MRLVTIISAALLGCISLVLGMTSVLSAHTRQAPPCLAGNPTPSTPISPAPSTPGVIFINEVLPFPQSHWNCANLSATSFNNDAWIELYNASDQAFNLYNASTFITNEEDQHYYFPLGAAIASHGFYVVFPQDVSPPMSLTGLHLFINDTLVDSVALPTSFPLDQSYARIPDGGPSWQIATTSTIGSSNVVVAQVATPTATKSPSKKPASHSKKTSSTRSGSANNGQDSSSGDTGQSARQPSWKTMQLPGTATPAATSTPAKNQASILPRAILLAASSLALLFALAWCWKLFKLRWLRLPSKAVISAKIDQILERRVDSSRF